MSGNYAGITFANQKISPSDDAIVRRAILPDGKLTGCEISYSGSTLTMSAGHLMVCGRQIRNPAAQNWAVVDATSGYARLVLTIDLTRTSTKETFDQVTDAIEYATAQDGFTSLEQADINGSGTRYQVAVCTVSLGTGGITGIVSQLEKCEVGGGANFNVVGGLTQPTDPKENTIWVRTDEKITSWFLSPEAPSDPEPGMVWIRTGETGPVALSVLKKGNIYVYPRSASQYIGGAWVRLEAMSFQDGQWAKWITYTYLYDSGDECTDITGGWAVAGKKASSSSHTDAKAPTLTRAEDYLLAKLAEDEKAGILYEKKAVDLTGCNKLVAEDEFYLASETASSANLAVCIWTSIGTYYQTNLVSRVGVSEKGTVIRRLEMDLSTIDGAHVVGFLINTTNNAGGSYVKLSRCWLES